MAAIDELVKISEKHDEGLKVLIKIQTTLEEMKKSDKLSMDIEDLDSGKRMLEFRFSSTDMYVRMEIRSKLSIETIDGTENFDYSPVFFWGFRFKKPNGKYIELDQKETVYYNKYLLVNETGKFVMREEKEYQDLPRVLGDIILYLVKQAELKTFTESDT